MSTSTLAPAHSPVERAGAARTGVARANTTRLLWLVASLAVLALVTAASLMIGSKDIPIDTVIASLLGREQGSVSEIVMEQRLPRTLLGLLVGAALGIAGALIQAFTRNPLADPGILGVNAGASFFVVLGVGFLGLYTIQSYLWLAFLGAFVATAVVYTIGSLGRGGATPVRLTLAGVALGAVLGGISSAVTLLNPGAFDRLRFWGAGSLMNRSMDVVVTVLPFIVIGLLIAIACTRSLNAVALGDELARSLGSRIGLTRVGVIASVTLLSGAATAAAGPIGFVGLMIPHIARWIVGPDQRWIFAYTLTLAPTLLLAADIVGRIVIRPAELQVGIVTAFIGAPVLIWLVRTTRASGL